MVALNYFGFRRGHGGLKKSVTLIPDLNHFFRHVTSFLSSRATLFGPAAAGLLWVWIRPSLQDSLLFVRTAIGTPVDLTVHNLQSQPVAVFFFVPVFAQGSRKSFQQTHRAFVVLSGCPLF